MVAEDQQDKQQFSLNDFEGPLDLLLFLIKKNEVNIYDIPIKSITEQYIQYLDLSTQVDMDNITEFYVMASTLLYIKSRMLLPVEIDLNDELDDPRQELVAKLIEHQKFKKLSELMSQQEESAEFSLQRKKKQQPLPFKEEDSMWEQLEVWDLLKTFSGLMKSLSSERIINLYEEVSINEKISLIHEFLEEKGEFLFEELIRNPESIMEVVCSFLAILESVKVKKISIYQNRLFGDIRIKKYSGNEDAIGD